MSIFIYRCCFDKNFHSFDMLLSNKTHCCISYLVSIKILCVPSNILNQQRTMAEAKKEITYAKKTRDQRTTQHRVKKHNCYCKILWKL